MIQLWAGGCYDCMYFSEISPLRGAAREWRKVHERAKGCKKARVYRVTLTATS